MTRFYLIFSLCMMACTAALWSQTDTLLFEDFQGNWDLRYLEFPDEDNYGSDSIWINFDLDGEAAAQSRPQNFYLALDFASPDSIPPADTNVVAASSSWMASLSAQNLNWLITPPIQILDDQATLHWKSAPFQGPRYLDGYKVLIATEGFDPLFGYYTDTIFVAAEMLTPLPNGSNDPNDDALEVDSFNISPGYVHADRFSLEEYYTYTEGDDIFVCLLEPHSYSLAAYAGQTIYVAFLHDSFDDNLISFDDILVLGNLTSSVDAPEAEDIRLVTYPNPVDNYLNVLFQVKEAAQVQVALFDLNGKKILTLNSQGKLLGEQQLPIDLSRLNAGMYELQLNVGGTIYTRKVVKR